MKNVTNGQKRFLFIYPFVHTGLSVPLVLMALQTGIFADETQASSWDHVVSNTGTFLIHLLWAPLYWLKKMGINLYMGGLLDYVWIFLVGVLYGYMLLVVYKLIGKK